MPVVDAKVVTLLLKLLYRLVVDATAVDATDEEFSVETFFGLSTVADTLAVDAVEVINCVVDSKPCTAEEAGECVKARDCVVEGKEAVLLFVVVVNVDSVVDSVDV